MMKVEFERMTLRGNEEISSTLYDTIERFYMSQNDYHRVHGGINETKEDFCKRVFGGKVNTAKTIAVKILKERISENEFCTGRKNYRENILLAEQTAYEFCNNYIGCRYEVMKDILRKAV
ncbi:hypothetical protein [Anaeromicropila populeti]|uniref:Uncharacterized protein n=1 Tax=Anaeromicropila populeti TaxID=37658 RepID=A0A1I6L0U6_9FIRM|nr:hypothetical protein [Anaeromicropila populeti]SFR97113.1 hypothetical protein SAMN05661086_02970 [Anaeromicropila populeti]